jgi:hypothetical protein
MLDVTIDGTIAISHLFSRHSPRYRLRRACAVGFQHGKHVGGSG